MGQIPTQMPGAILPGNSTVELRTFEVPTPGHGEVLVRTKSTTICGSDIRCIYHQHLGKGPEGYQPGMIAGHEPCGQIVAAGPGCRRFTEGDRVVVYHISGCGLCNDCRRGYMISCTSPWRRAPKGDSYLPKSLRTGERFRKGPLDLVEELKSRGIAVRNHMSESADDDVEKFGLFTVPKKKIKKVPRKKRKLFVKISCKKKIFSPKFQQIF